jgi:hypothetical protein
MDASIVGGILAAQAGNVQIQVAAEILKSSNLADQSEVDNLLGAVEQNLASLANVAAGIGNKVDKTA